MDFLIFDLLETNVNFAKFDFGLKNIDTVDVLAKFPKLNNFFRTISKRPRIAKYMNSSRRFQYIEVPNIPKWNDKVLNHYHDVFVISYISNS